jgi:hypothetical protein
VVLRPRDAFVRFALNRIAIPTPRNTESEMPNATLPDFHEDQSAMLSRRGFVGHSALGLLGAAGLASVARSEQKGSGAVVASALDPDRFGLKRDGKTDDTRGIQAALDAAKAGAPVVLLPPGHYRVEGALTVPPGVALCGSSGGAPHSEHPIGTVLLALGGRGNAEGEPLITLKPNAVLRHLTIHYPEQKLPEVAPYPWSIRIDGELCQVLDVTLTNPYQAIDAGTRWNELHCIRNIFACPLKTGVYIDQCSDIGRVENVHFNPNFWTRMALEPRFSGADIRGYLERNLVGFKIGRTDWEYMSNCFVIFPKVGFHFDDFGHGCGNAVVTQSGSDICPVAVRVDRVQDHAGVQWANGQFMSTIEIGPRNRGPVKLANCGFWGMETTQEHIRHAGPSTLMLTACHFVAWDRAAKKDPCIRASAGRLIVNGCEFMDEGKQAIRLEHGLKAAAVLGCALRGAGTVENVSGVEVQIGFNAQA